MPVLLASDKDYMDVMFLLSRCTADMNQRSMFHWNRSYPGADIIYSDIHNNSLYIYHVQGVCQGMIVLNEDQSEEYSGIEWKDQGGKVLVVHRLAVHPVFQQKGIGKALMEFAVEHARKEGYSSIRLDVISDNPSAGNLYSNLGFRETGSFHFPFQKNPFICYEKEL